MLSNYLSPWPSLRSLEDQYGHQVGHQCIRYSQHINDKYFRRIKAMCPKKEKGDIFEQKQEVKGSYCAGLGWELCEWLCLVLIYWVFVCVLVFCQFCFYIFVFICFLAILFLHLKPHGCKRFLNKHIFRITMNWLHLICSLLECLYCSTKRITLKQSWVSYACILKHYFKRLFKFKYFFRCFYRSKGR